LKKSPTVALFPSTPKNPKQTQHIKYHHHQTIQDDEGFTRDCVILEAQQGNQLKEDFYVMF
jgi:hypothetical protein